IAAREGLLSDRPAGDVLQKLDRIAALQAVDHYVVQHAQHAGRQAAVEDRLDGARMIERTGRIPACQASLPGSHGAVGLLVVLHAFTWRAGVWRARHCVNAPCTHSALKIGVLCAARRFFPETARRGDRVQLSWPLCVTFSTARKASCGMSTLPTRFIRRLPSFCFSSSLRLRVMSPP